MTPVIPKLIHYCWFGRGPMSDLNRRCLDSWRRVLPDYTICAWTEDNAPLDEPYCRDMMARGFWSKVSNHVRLDVLHRHGGWYFDTDIEAIRGIDDLCALNCVLGFQLREPHVDWVNGAVIGAHASHPFLAHCLHLLRNTYAQTGNIPRGPELVSTALRRAGLAHYGQQTLHDVTLMPVETFYPYSWTERFDPACITPETRLVHHWEGTWCAPERAAATLRDPDVGTSA